MNANVVCIKYLAVAFFFLCISSVGAFAQLTPPTLNSPVGGATYGAEPPTFRFTVNFAGNYVVVLSSDINDCEQNDGDWNSSAYFVAEGQTKEVPIDGEIWGALANGDYYWHVSGGADGPPYVVHSEECRLIRKRCSGSPSGTPSLKFPEDGASFDDISDIAFSWNDSFADYVFYRVQIASDSGFEHIVLNSYDVNGAVWDDDYIFLYSDLQDGTYYWRVQAGQCNPPYWSNSNNRIFAIGGTSCYIRNLRIEPPKSIYDCGETVTLNWDSEGVNSYKVEFYNGSDWTSIGSTTIETTVYDLPRSDFDRSNCKFRVSDDDGNCPDEPKSGVFNINKCDTDKYIDITSPASGVKWKVDEYHDIEWTSSGVTGNVTIKYSTNGGAPWKDVGSNIENSGSYKWKIPDAVSQNCVVRVESMVETEIFDNSGVFEIYRDIPPEDDDTYIYRVNNEPFLSFKVIDGKWEGAGKRKIKNTDSVVEINDFLKFSGTMTIDTTVGDVTFSSYGAFYLEGIIVGGEPTKFILYDKGIEVANLDREVINLNIIDENDEEEQKYFKYRQDYFAGIIKVIPKKLELLEGFNAVGLRMGCDVWFSHTKNCNDRRRRVRISLENLEFYSDGQFIIDGKIVGLSTSPGFCLRYLGLKYNSPENCFEFDGGLWTPFFGNRTDEGKGLFLKARNCRGNWEEVEFKASLGNPIPIGNTGIGVVGVEGGINNISSPPPDVYLGGTFAPIAAQELFELNIVGSYRAPSLLKLKGDAKLFRIPATDIWGIPDASLEAWLDWNSSLGLNGAIKAGYLGGETAVVEGNASMKYVWSPRSELTGSLNSAVNIPDIGSGFPFDWINMFLGLPYRISSSVAVLKDSKILGNVNMPMPIGDMNFALDLEKRYGENGFFDLGQGYRNLNGTIRKEDDIPATLLSSYQLEGQSLPLYNVSKNEEPLAATSDTIEVDKTIEKIIIRIKSETSVPKSSLKDPLGNVYEDSDEDNAIFYMESDKLAFWTVLLPAHGDWIVTVENPAAGDSIDVYSYKRKEPFNIDVEVKDSIITVSWNKENNSQDSKIDFFLDDNKDDFDGFYIGSASGKDDSFTYTLSDSITGCYFYLHATRYENSVITRDYFKNIIMNDKEVLHPPIIKSCKVVGSGQIEDTVEIAWENPSNNYDIYGYSLRIIDVVTKEDSIYAMVFYPDTTVRVGVIHPETKVFQMISYNETGRSGCWTPKIALTDETVDVMDNSVSGDNKELKIYPNPASSSVNIEFVLEEPQLATLTLQNSIGDDILCLIDNERRQQGVNRIEFNSQSLPNGLYFCTLNIGGKMITEKLIILK